MRATRTTVSAALAILCLSLAGAGLASRGSGSSSSGSEAGTAHPYFRAHHTKPAGLPFSMVPPSLHDQRPNVVVIMADDMRTDELKYMPITQRLLADKGATFRNGISPYPLCCPARASFLSGEYAQNHKVWSNKPPFGFAAFHDKETIPVWMSRAGYNTAFIGKYLNGYGWMLDKKSRTGENTVHYIPPGWTDWRGSIDGGLAGQPADGGTYRYYDTTLNRNGTFVDNGGHYATRMVMSNTYDMITGLARSSRPFFYWASYIAPHVGSPREPDDPEPRTLADGSRIRIGTPARPASLAGSFDKEITGPPGPVGEKDVSDKPYYIRQMLQPDKQIIADITTMARQRAEALTVLDRQVGHTVHLLEKLGVLDNTYIVFLSDNGYFMGEHRKPQGKTITYEPGPVGADDHPWPGHPRGRRARGPLLDDGHGSDVPRRGRRTTRAPARRAEHAARGQGRRRGLEPRRRDRGRSPVGVLRRGPRPDARQRGGSPVSPALLGGHPHRSLPLRRALPGRSERALRLEEGPVRALERDRRPAVRRRTPRAGAGASPDAVLPRHRVHPAVAALAADTPGDTFVPVLPVAPPVPGVTCFG